MAEHDQQQALKPCADCGMPCEPGEYHPFAACLMFKACHNSDVVRASLEFVRGAAPSRAAEDARDAARLDYLQRCGATVSMVAPGMNGGPPRFMVGGLWATASASVRASIDAAMATDTPAASVAKEV